MVEIMSKRELEFYKFYFHDGLTLSEIGNMHNMSRERVRQILSKVISKCKMEIEPKFRYEGIIT